MIAGGLFAIIAAPISCFVMWNRLSYYSDAISHASILGVALSIFLKFDPVLGVILFSTFFALTIYALKEEILPIDSVIGVVSCLSISIAIILVTMTNIRIDLMGYLFGDILLVTVNEIFYELILAIFLYGWLIMNWDKLLLFFINKDMASAERINCGRLKLYLMVIIAITVAISIKILGVLLVTALLMFPAMTARQVASSPINMAIWAGFFAFAAVIMGIIASIAIDVPTGPTIVCCAFTLHIMVRLLFMAAGKRI